MKDSIHVFDNGVRVFDKHLNEAQRVRYGVANIHEPDEEAHFLRLVGAIAPRGVFVSVGAALGYYPILAKQKRPDIHVHALEPLEEHREFMAANVRLNGLPDGSIQVHPFALSARDGTAILDVQSFNTKLRNGHQLSLRAIKDQLKRCLNVLRPGRYGMPQRRTEVVSLQSLVDIVSGRIDLLQLDIQGLEAEVLAASEGALRAGAVKSLLIGTHSMEIHQRCSEIIASAGFVVDYSDPAPHGQPDGVLVASLREQTEMCGEHRTVVAGSA